MVVADDITERDSAIEQIAAKLGVQAERGRRFAELTSLRVGGAIDWVISPKTEQQAAAFVHELEQSEIPWRPLGSGSNVLADDGEHHYVIVSLKDLKADPVFESNRVSVSAGYSLPRLCIDAARQSLSGIEGLNGIPGTVGGALWMNAGAYGQEIGTVVQSIRVAREGRVHEMPGYEVQWNYRHTSFREGELLLGATLVLHADDPKAIAERMENGAQESRVVHGRAEVAHANDERLVERGQLLCVVLRFAFFLLPLFWPTDVQRTPSLLRRVPGNE